jgi:hypothetical protein
MDLIIKNRTKIECLKSGWLFQVRGEYLILQRDINTGFLAHTWKFKTKEGAQEAFEMTCTNIRLKRHFINVETIFPNSL